MQAHDRQATGRLSAAERHWAFSCEALEHAGFTAKSRDSTFPRESMKLLCRTRFYHAFGVIPDVGMDAPAPRSWSFESRLRVSRPTAHQRAQNSTKLRSYTWPRSIRPASSTYVRSASPNMRAKMCWLFAYPEDPETGKFWPSLPGCRLRSSLRSKVGSQRPVACGALYGVWKRGAKRAGQRTWRVNLL